MYENMQRRPASTSNDAQQQQSASSTSIPMQQFVASSVGSYVFETGKQRAQQALNIYSHIDYLRPYFDVEPKDVLHRLIYSFVPVEFAPKLSNELYGPLMLMFSLSAILIYQMKMANHSVEDGTLIGTAFFICFSYWLGFSFLISSATFVCNSSISLINYLSLIGYSVFSHCVVLLIGTFIHTSYDHVIFYLLWSILAGTAGLKLAFVIFQHTPHPKYKFLLAIFAIFIHLVFLLYLHFAYHELAEEVSHALIKESEQLKAQLFTESIKKQIFDVTEAVARVLKREITGNSTTSTA